jgi:class 3 adenylate cyclase
LSVKLGVSAGACLAVRANERLDFFGTTVNLAARFEARAKGGQLVVTKELAAHPRVQALLAGFSKTPFKAALKGIAAEQELLAVAVVSPNPG